jgi:hypothetical protein
LVSNCSAAESVAAARSGAAQTRRAKRIAEMLSKRLSPFGWTGRP